MIKLLVISLILVIPTFTQISPIFYVSFNGTDINNFNCSEENPCGTLYHATRLREVNEAFNKLDEIEIFLNGINLKEININKPICHELTMSLVITFNQTSMSDILNLYHSINALYHQRYIFLCVMSSSNDKLTINNLNINNNTFGYAHIVDGIVRLQSQGTLILNNATVENIDIYALYHTFNIPNLEIYNSTFSNIEMWTDTDDEWEMIPGFIYINNGGFIINNCNIFNLYFWDIHFLVNWQNNKKQNYQLIQHCIFDFSDIYDVLSFSQITYYFNWNLDRTFSLFYFQYGQSNIGETSVFINDSSFIDCINILHLDDRCHLSASLNNIDIEVSYFNSRDLLNIDRALFMVTETAKLTINNVNLTYKHFSKVQSQSYWQQMPYRFLSNKGSVIMNNVYVSNDLTQDLLNEYMNYYSNREDIFNFWFDPYGSDSASMIWNERGQMVINNITFYGVLLHNQILHNTGIVFIENFNLLRPDYYYNHYSGVNFKSGMDRVIFNEGMHYDLTSETCSEQNCYFDDINLKLTNGIIILNSQIHGGSVAIWDEFGYVEIHNTLISDIPIAILSYQSDVFKLYSSHLKNIGIYHSDDLYAREWYLNIQVYFENSKNVLIEDNLFGFFPRNHFVYFKTDDKNINTFIEIRNNAFVNYCPISPIDCVTLNEFNITKRWSDLYLKEHLVHIEGYIQSSIFIGNIFPENDLIMPIFNKSCLYINDYNWPDNNESFHCISGNIFNGYAIYLERGKISSCIHSELLTNTNGKCWSEFGSLNIKDDSNIYDHFIANNINMPVITLLNQSHMILDKTIFSTNFSKNLNSVHKDFYNPFSATETNGIIAFLDVIIDDSNNPIDIRFLGCINLCTKLYNDSMNYIHQLHLNCIDSLQTSNQETFSLSTTPINNITAVNHTTPIKLILGSSQALFPGGRLNISFVIVDIDNNTIHDYEENIEITFMSDELNFKTVMNLIDVSETGLYIQNVRMDASVHQNYTITTSLNDNILLINNLNVVVVECPSGFGLHKITSQCFECSVGEFSIKPSMSSCFKCNSNSNNVVNGVQCLGGNKISISNNYWIGINKTIISQFCGSNNCNQQNNGLYLELKQENKLCATNRDPNSLLCSNCITGHSEVIGSNTCKKCKNNNWWLLIVPLIMSILIVCAMIAIDHPDSTNVNNTETNINKSEMNYVKLVIKDDLQSVQITFLRPFTYFFQGLSYITIQTGLWFHLSPLMALFSFDFFAQNSGASGLCFLKNLKSIDKELWQLFFPFCMFIVVGLFFMFNMFLKSKYNQNIIGLDIVWSIILILIGNIIEKMLKILACINVGEDTVHFYGAYQECFGFIWGVALTVMIIVIIVWIILWYLLYKMDETKRDSRKSYLRTITKPYKLQFYWWEVILISRRTLIAFLVTFRYSHYYFVQAILLILLVIYLCLHIQFAPFKYKRANIMDGLGLLLLIIALQLIILQSYEYEYKSMVSVMITIIVLIPILLLTFYCVLVIKHCIEIKRNTPIVGYQDRVENMRLRLTKSQQMINKCHRDIKFDEITNEEDDIELTSVDLNVKKENEFKSLEEDETILDVTLFNMQSTHL